MIGDEHYVYHAPVEPSPRATASGDQNIVGLGYVIDRWLPVQQQPGPNRLPPGVVQLYPPNRPPVCPAWGCDGPGIPPTRRTPYPYSGEYAAPGATATTLQPPPSAGGSQVVPLTQPLPLSPAPSPTVAVSSDQTSPQLTQPGTTLDSSGASITTASGIGTWLAQSTLISGIPNWGIAAVGVFAAMMMFGGKAGRR